MQEVMKKDGEILTSFMAQPHTENCMILDLIKGLTCLCWV